VDEVAAFEFADLQRQPMVARSYPLRFRFPFTGIACAGNDD